MAQLESLQCLNSCSFLPLHTFKVPMHPKSPAEMQKSQLWTLITFFWLGLVAPNLRLLLSYMYISFYKRLLLFEALYKNLQYFNFLSIPSAFDYLGSHIKVSLGVTLELKRPLTQAWGGYKYYTSAKFQGFWPSLLSYNVTSSCWA